MKKIILIGLIFLSISAIAQTYPPYYQNLGSPSTAVEDKGGLFVRGTFVPPQFVDTTAANAAPHTRFYAGSAINTTSDNLYWYRSNDLTQWIKMGSGSGGSGTDSLSFHSITQSSDSTSAKFNRPNGSSTVLKFVYDTTGGGNSGITQQQLDDTASAIRDDFPVYTASNGLTMTSNNVTLGGTLTGNTNISEGSYTTGLTGNNSSVTFNGTNATIQANGVRITHALKNKSSYYFQGTEPNSLSILYQDTVYLGGAYRNLGSSYGIGDTSVLQYNTGYKSNAFGSGALQNNTGSQSNGFGLAALQNNTGSNSSGFGNGALQNNTGFAVTGFGLQAAQYNTGNNSSGLGSGALQNNTGANATGFGNAALEFNVGDTSLGMGVFSLMNNNWGSRIAIGYYSGNDTTVVMSTTKTFATANISGQNITITGHGFGVTGKKINLIFNNLSGTNPSGFINHGVYQATVIDANTLSFIEALTGSSGTFSFSKDIDKSGSIVIGNNTNNTKANQVILGSSNITETVLRGNILLGTTAQLMNYTVSTLPTGVQGMTAYVTDASATPTWGGTATGGGSIVAKVFYNGTAWIYE